MTCHRFKKDMLMDVYGELDPKERRRLEDHLSRCPSCRREFEMTRHVLASLDTAQPGPRPEADWERSWKRIEASLEPARRRPKFFATLPRWAFAPPPGRAS
jgi:anti-sigma factor RsiW